VSADDNTSILSINSKSSAALAAVTPQNWRKRLEVKFQQIADFMKLRKRFKYNVVYEKRGSKYFAINVYNLD